MRLVEPLGLLWGRAAHDAVASGLALPLAGGPAAFTLARLLGGTEGGIVPVAAIPSEFAEAVENVTCVRPAWAGLVHDRPLVMGILNRTPDSFSDRGVYADPAAAIAAGRRMRDEGADILDIGGESTRPGAPEVAADVEQARVLPVIEALAGDGMAVSVDTRHAATAAAALRAGARIVNDVSGFAFDAGLAAVAARHDAAVVVMHMRGTPETMQRLTAYRDVAGEVVAELDAAIRRLPMTPARIVVDPGIGFAKDTGQNEALLARLPLLLNLGCRILVGVSRKGFLGRIAGVPDPLARLPGSLAAGLAAVLGGASILRVHDVAATVQALRVWRAVTDAA